MIIWAIIPAHNEELVISQTIRSLQNQTVKPQRIIVIVDNCSDLTEKVARFERAETFVTKNNKHKKAGAYNQFLQSVGRHEVDFLLLMDADTILAKNAIEVGIEHFQDQRVAAVCSKAGVQELQGHHNFFEKFIYRLQKIEYGLYDSQRIETYDHIKVVHGMAALHRWRCLKEAGLFNEDCITEDYYLTLIYKKLGYLVVPELKMKAWTSVPVNALELCNQRIRWNRGGIDALRELGWNKGTYKDILMHIWGNFVNIVLFYVYIRWISYMIDIERYQITYHWLILFIIIFYLYDRIYRIRKYVDNMEKKDWFIVFSLIPEMIYGQLQTTILYISYVKSLMKTNKNW